MKSTIVLVCIMLVSAFAFAGEPIPVKSENSKLVVIRSNSLFGCAIKYRIFVDGKESHRLARNKYWETELNTGSSEVSFRNKFLSKRLFDRSDEVKLCAVEPGQTYYVYTWPDLYSGRIRAKLLKPEEVGRHFSKKKESKAKL